MPTLFHSTTNPSATSKSKSKSTTKNPYTSPTHAVHIPSPKRLPPSRSPSPSPPPSPQRTRSASPLPAPNFLAEARSLLARDPITGRPLPPSLRIGSGSGIGSWGGDGQWTWSQSPAVASPSSRSLPSAMQEPEESARARRKREKREREDRSVYELTSERRVLSMGSKYDIWRSWWRREEGERRAREAERKEEERRERERAMGGMQGFYAPERRVGEFYAPAGVSEFYGPRHGLGQEQRGGWRR